MVQELSAAIERLLVSFAKDASMGNTQYTVPGLMMLGRLC